MTWTTEQRVVVALWGEHEPTQDLARWARGETALMFFCPLCGAGAEGESPKICPAPSCRILMVASEPTPVPDPLDVEAYRADCARRGVEPWPLPSLEHGRCGDSAWWSIWNHRGTLHRGLRVYVGVGFHTGAIVTSGVVRVDVNHMSIDNFVLLARLAKAAAEAMR